MPAPGRCGGIPVAPVNRLAMLTDIIRPRTTVVPCANQDVIYGFGMFDLAADAVVIQIPDFGARFWLYQLGDHRTDAFARVGRMHGTQPGCYLVVGPDWRGTIPAGIAGVFRCPTRYGYCLPRVHVNGTEEDRQAAPKSMTRSRDGHKRDEWSSTVRTSKRECVVYWYSI